METHVTTPEKILVRRSIFSRYWFYLPVIVLFFSSCHVEPWYGNDGRPGDAFLAITWLDAQPGYIDAGTGDIPPVFEYGRFYHAWPGLYTMYYDGRLWNGQAHVFYAWEVDYEIWVVRGEPGGLYYNGADGVDNHFTIECSPFGPWVYGPGYKSATLADGYEILEDKPEKIVIQKEGTDYGITLTYKKVVPRDGNP